MKEIGVTISRLSDEVIDELENHISELHEEYGLDSDDMHAFQLFSVGYSAAWDEVERLNQRITEKDEENKQLMTMAEDWQRQCVQALVERDKLRKALKEARDNIGVIDAHGENPWEVTSYCEKAIEAIDAALGEGDPLTKIYQYIEKCGYTYKPHDVLAGYQEYQEGHYVSHTMKDCISNLEAEIKAVLGGR